MHRSIDEVRASGKVVVPSSLANPMPKHLLFSTMHVDRCLRRITRLIRRLIKSDQCMYKQTMLWDFHTVGGRALR